MRSYLAGCFILASVFLWFVLLLLNPDDPLLVKVLIAGGMVVCVMGAFFTADIDRWSK